MKFFTHTCCDFMSRKISAHNFVQCVESLSDNTDFYTNLKTASTPAKLTRLVEQIAFIRRPMRSAIVFCRAAQHIASFQKVKIRLLTSFPSKSVQHVLLPKGEFPMSPSFQRKFEAELTKVKWVHAEIQVMIHLLGEGSPVGMVTYLGASKKTCFLCGHVIRQMCQFQTRGNHGKMYSQWTLPSAVLDGGIPRGFRMPAGICGRH